MVIPEIKITIDTNFCEETLRFVNGDRILGVGFSRCRKRRLGLRLRSEKIESPLWLEPLFETPCKKKPSC
jgi:hypothetical protein